MNKEALTPQEVLIEALKEIVSPVKYMQERLKDGEQLDGVYAVLLSKEASYLQDIAKRAMESYASQPSLPLDWEKEFDTAFCNEIIESNGTEGGLRDNELQMFWEGAEFLRNKAKEWFKTHLLSKVSYGSGMSEDMIKKTAEEIAQKWDVYYHESGEVNELVVSAIENALSLSKSSATPSDEDIERK